MMHLYAHKNLIAQYDTRYPDNGDYSQSYKESKFYDDHKHVINAVTEVNHYFSGNPMVFDRVNERYMLYLNGMMIYSARHDNVIAYCKGFINAHCMHIIGMRI